MMTRWLFAVAFFATACKPGAYPVDAFNEMHYQPSQRRLEPDRLAPPPDAVPITGAAPDYTFDEATGLQNPIVRSPQDLTIELTRALANRRKRQVVVAPSLRALGRRVARRGLRPPVPAPPPPAVASTGKTQPAGF